MGVQEHPAGSGESILQTATEFRGNPVQLILLVEGRQINVQVNLPHRGEESDPEDPEVVRIADWGGYAGTGWRNARTRGPTGTRRTMTRRT